MKDYKLQNLTFIAKSIPISQIAEPIRIIVTPDEELLSVWEQLMSNPYGDWFCLVQDTDKINGYLALDDESFTHLKGNAGSTATPIDVNLILPASLSFLDVIPLIAKRSPYFLLTENRITNILCFQDFDKLPAKLAIMSLFLQFEENLIDLFSINEVELEKHIKYLSLGRLEKARELYNKKYKGRENDLYNLLLCTTFIDKKTMLLKDKELVQRLIFFKTRSDLDDFFNLLEKVRNNIAHSDSILIILSTPDVFYNFIKSLEQITGLIKSMLSERQEI